jgi:hypothetical protein
VSESAKRLLDRIEALDTATADTRHRVDSYQRMAAELASVRGRAASPDGLVSAVATASGALCAITFSESIRTVPPATLSAAVLHTVAAARMAATRDQAEVVRRGLGDTELLDQVLASDERLFGDHRPAEPGPPPTVPRHVPRPQQRRPRTPIDDGEPSYEYNAVLRRPPTG